MHPPLKDRLTQDLDHFSGSRQGAFEASDPKVAALAFWSPVMSLAAIAEDRAREADAERLLRARVEHFHSTHRRMKERWGLSSLLCWSSRSCRF